MQKVIHRSNERGCQDHGWLNTCHSFSFGNYFDPQKMGFGRLRVLNDDQVAPGKGFPLHSHKNMEIVSIPLEGALVHEDNMGHKSVIKKGDVQVMSAGSGIFHSEANYSEQDFVKFFQIWIEPREQEVDPRYDQANFDEALFHNQFHPLVSPEHDQLWLHQDTWFFWGNFDAEQIGKYKLHSPDNGIYLMVVEGKVLVADDELNRRDAVGIWEFEEVEVKALTDSQVLVIEVPMK